MIVRGGLDITNDVMDQVKARQISGAPLKVDEAIVYLIKARTLLNELPRPWLFDCIHDSIKQIDVIIDELHSPAELRK